MTGIAFKACMRAINPTSIIKAFKKTGIFHAPEMPFTGKNFSHVKPPVFVSRQKTVHLCSRQAVTDFFYKENGKQFENLPLQLHMC